MADRLTTEAELKRRYLDAQGALPVPGVHPDEDLWVALAAGTTTPDARAEAFDHILRCRACTTTWRGIEALREDAEAAGLLPRPSTAWMARLSSPAVRYALAAALVVAVGGALVMRPGEEATPVDAPTNGSAPSETAPPPPREGPPPATTTMPRPWLDSFPLARAAIHITAQEALVMRGTAAPAAGLTLESLGHALDPYRRDDFAEAVTRLTPLWSAHEADGRPALYLGVSLLHLDRDADAVAPLRSALESDLAEVAADARWYLAMALARTGDLDGATTEARTACEAGGRGGPRACDALRALEARPR